MADNLRPRLDRLQILAKQLNAVSDEIGKVVQGVESYLNETLYIGVVASVEIDRDTDPTGSITSRRMLLYSRYGPKFRIVVSNITEVDGNEEKYEETLWANCPRDLKLLAFDKLPALLDKLILRMEAMLDQVDVGYDAIQAMIPAKGKAAKK
jgi:hypothetical protein